MLKQFNKLLEQLDEGLINQAECIQHMVVIAMAHGCKENDATNIIESAMCKENSNVYN